MTDAPLPMPPPSGQYAWRPLRVADAAPLRELEQLCAHADGAPEAPSLAELLRHLEGAAKQLATDSLAAADAAGRVVAAGRVEMETSLAHEYRAYLHTLVDPQHRYRGWDLFLLDWVEARGRVALAALPDDRPKLLRIDVLHQNEALMALYQQQGFQFAMAEDEMRRDLEEAIPTNPLAEPLRFAEWTPERAPHFFAVYEAAFRERPGFPGWSEATWRVAFSENDAFRADLSLLVLDGTTPVGYAVCGIEAEEGELLGHILQIGVVPAARGQGIADALLSEAMRRFTAEGLRFAALEVNVNNPGAARVYQRLGFVRSKRYSVFRKRVEA